MSDIYDLLLAKRTHRPVPSNYQALLGEQGGVMRTNLSPDLAEIEVKAIYSAEAKSEMMKFKGKYYALIDFRFIEFVSDLVNTFEVEDDHHRATGIMFTFYSSILEQTIGEPECSFQRGALIDYLVSRTSAFTHYNFKGLDDPDLGRLDYIAKLTVAHELAHFWFKIDPSYVQTVVTQFDDFVMHLESVGAQHDGKLKTNPILASAKHARELLNVYRENQKLSRELEEMLCDFVMTWSGAHAAIKSHKSRENLYTFISLTTATLTALWAVPILQEAVKAIVNDQQVNLNPGTLRDTRSVFALMTFMRITGEALGNEGSWPGEAIAKLWEDTADFDAACTDTLNAMLSAENVERLILIGESSYQIGIMSEGDAKSALLNMFEWV